MLKGQLSFSRRCDGRRSSEVYSPVSFFVVKRAKLRIEKEDIYVNFIQKMNGSFVTKLEDEFIGALGTGQVRVSYNVDLKDYVSREIERLADSFYFSLLRWSLEKGSLMILKSHKNFFERWLDRWIGEEDSQVENTSNLVKLRISLDGNASKQGMKVAVDTDCEGYAKYGTVAFGKLMCRSPREDSFKLMIEIVADPDREPGSSYDDKKLSDCDPYEKRKRAERGREWFAHVKELLAVGVEVILEK